MAWSPDEIAHRMYFKYGLGAAKRRVWEHVLRAYEGDSRFDGFWGAVVEALQDAQARKLWELEHKQRSKRTHGAADD